MGRSPKVVTEVIPAMHVQQLNASPPRTPLSQSFPDLLNFSSDCMGKTHAVSGRLISVAECSELSVKPQRRQFIAGITSNLGHTCDSYMYQHIHYRNLGSQK